MKCIDGEELNGFGKLVGVIVWLVIMAMVGVQRDPNATMGVGADSILHGIIAIGMLAPAWIAASFVSSFSKTK